MGCLMGCLGGIPKDNIAVSSDLNHKTLGGAIRSDSRVAKLLCMSNGIINTYTKKNR